MFRAAHSRDIEPGSWFPTSYWTAILPFQGTLILSRITGDLCGWIAALNTEWPRDHQQKGLRVWGNGRASSTQPTNHPSVHPSIHPSTQ